MSAFRRVLLVVALLAPAACEKKTAPASNALPPSGLPPLGEAMPPSGAPGDKPVHDPTGMNNPHGGGAMPAGHPAIGGAEGMGDQTTPGDIAFDPKTVIKGVLRVDDKLKSKVAEGDVIYLVARSAAQPGPPLAVKRLTAGKFPMAFELDNRDAMMAGTKMSGKVTISARVDKDGDAMTKNPGDVTGNKTVDVPADKVVLTLDTPL